jgi:hypothetical protein
MIHSPTDATQYVKDSASHVEDNMCVACVLLLLLATHRRVALGSTVTFCMCYGGRSLPR